MIRSSCTTAFVAGGIEGVDNDWPCKYQHCLFAFHRGNTLYMIHRAYNPHLLAEAVAIYTTAVPTPVPLDLISRPPLGIAKQRVNRGRAAYRTLQTNRRSLLISCVSFSSPVERCCTIQPFFQGVSRCVATTFGACLIAHVLRHIGSCMHSTGAAANPCSCISTLTDAYGEGRGAEEWTAYGSTPPVAKARSGDIHFVYHYVRIARQAVLRYTNFTSLWNFTAAVRRG